MEQRLKSAEQVKAEFRRAGVSVGSWATANGYERADVYAVINGRNKFKYGKAHAIAVALGIKEGFIGTPETFKSPSAVMTNGVAP